MKNLLLAHLALLGLNLLYGANHILAKGVMPDHLGPNVFILFRVAITALLFFGLFKILVREKVAPKHFFRLAVCGFFGVALNQLFFFNGLAITSAFNAGIIMTSTPILVVLLAFFILKEPITWMKAIGVAVGAFGAVSLILAKGAPQFDSPIGDLYILINALSFGVYLVLVKPLMVIYRPLTVITYNFLFGLIFVCAYPGVWLDVVHTDFTMIPITIWYKVSFVVFGATFLTYLLNIFALKHVSPSVSGSYIYTQPMMVILFTILFATLGWAEDYISTITAQKFIFMLLIFLGVFLISRSTYLYRKRQKTN